MVTGVWRNNMTMIKLHLDLRWTSVVVSWLLKVNNVLNALKRDVISVLDLETLTVNPVKVVTP